MPKTKIDLQAVLAHDKLHKKKIIHRKEVKTLRASIDEFISNNSAEKLFKEMQSANRKMSSDRKTLRKLDEKTQKIHEAHVKNERKENEFRKSNIKGSPKKLDKLIAKENEIALLEKENVAEKKMVRNKEKADGFCISLLDQQITQKNIALHEVNVGLKRVLNGQSKQEMCAMKEANAKILELRGQNLELLENNRQFNELLRKLEQSNDKIRELRSMDALEVSKSEIAIATVNKLQNDIATKEAKLREANRINAVLREKELTMEADQSTIAKQKKALAQQAAQIESLKADISKRNDKITGIKSRMATDLQLIMQTSQNEILAIVQAELTQDF